MAATTPSSDRQERVGAPPTRIAARKILYWRTANQVSVNDARFFDLDQGTAATCAPQPDEQQNARQETAGGEETAATPGAGAAP